MGRAGLLADGVDERRHAGVEVRVRLGRVLARSGLADSAAVFAKTGFVDDERSPADTNPLGAAKRLPAGTYELVLCFTWKEEAYTFAGVRFEVAGEKAEHGGWMLGPQ